MLSNNRPSLTIFGTPTTVGDTARHLTPGEQVQAARSGDQALLRPDDPRARVDMVAATAMAGMLSYEGLQRAAGRLPEGLAGDAQPTKGRAIQMALLNAAKEDAQNGTGQWAKHADESYGKPGRLAAALEGVGLQMYQEGQQTGNAILKAGAMQALTVAAAAHLVGAREAVVAGTSTDKVSVVDAAAHQRRDPMAVMGDMARLGVLPSTDPRAQIKEADLDLTQTEALKRVLPVRAAPLDPTTQIDRVEKVDIATTGRVVARQAEQRAVQLAGMGEGGQSTANTEAAHRQLAAAFAIERMRQAEQRSRQATVEAAPAQAAPAPRRMSVFGRGDQR